MKSTLALRFLVATASACLLSGLAHAQDSGYAIEIDYTGDYVSNLNGGLERGQVYLGNLDVILQLDGGKLWGMNNSTVYLYGLGNHGGSPSALAGDAQGLDNIEAPSTFKLYEAWVEHAFPGVHMSVLGGLLDVNAEFDVIGTSGLFINSSHGIGPDFSQSGVNGPSIFPVTSLGLRFKWSPNPIMYVKVAMLDGVSGDPNDPIGTRVLLDRQDGLLTVAEVGLLGGNSLSHVSRISRSAHKLKAGIGFWGYTAKTAPLLNGPRKSNWGVYGLLESNVYQEADDPDQGLGLFVRFGIAQPDVNRFGMYLGMGAVYQGPFPGRDGDQVGIGLAIAKNTDAYKSSLQLENATYDSAEYNVEASYLFDLHEAVSVQFDLQYIVHPDTDPTLDNALVSVMRWVFTF